MDTCLILCHADDRSAVRIYCALRKRLGISKVEVVSGEELALAPRWTHRIESGSSHTELLLADGRRIRSDRVGLVFQRLQQIPLPQFDHSKPDDRDYASAEMHALLLSWLADFPCPVVNGAGPRGLCGTNRSRLEWSALAVQAGLPIRGSELVSEARRFAPSTFVPHVAHGDTGLEDPSMIVQPQGLGRVPLQYLEPVESEIYRLLVVGGRCLGILPGIEQAACVALAKLSGNSLLEIRFGQVRGQWRFCSATPLPEILPESVDFVAKALLAMKEAA